MESQLLDIRRDAFSGFGAKSQYLDASLVDALGQHVYHHIGRGADQHLLLRLLDQVIDDTGTSYCLSGPWRALDKAKWLH